MSSCMRQSQLADLSGFGDYLLFLLTMVITIHLRIRLELASMETAFLDCELERKPLIQHFLIHL